MADKYTTHNVYLESADFNILVTAFPEEDINDKLAVLATERGLIYKSFYEDFVLGTCMANSGPFFYHIRRRRELMEKFEEIRQEALDTVYKFSPGFKPENIVINSNNILKTKKSTSSLERVRDLVKNELWDKDPPLTSFGPAIITTGPEPETPFQEDDGPSSDLPDIPMEPENPFGVGGGNGSDEVPYTLVGHKWDKLGLHINVRRYEEEEDHIVELLGGTPFESLRGYHLLIVQLCIEDFSDIFHLLDSMGVSKTTPPSELAAELYNIAIKYNSFLKLENVNLKEIRAKYRRKHKNKLKNNRRTTAVATDETDNNSAPKKHFVDVPKEGLLGLVKDLKKRVVGQDEALQTIGDAILRASVGLKREHEPLGVFLFTGSTGCGKCLAPGTEVLTYNGAIKVVEEVVVGDLLMGPDSLPREVLSVCSGEDEMFEIIPTKGKVWACNAPHVLSLVHTQTNEVIDISLDEYLLKNKTFKHLHKLFKVPVNFPQNEVLDLDPYFVGLWLGDGKKDLSGIQISNTDKEIITYLTEIADKYGLTLTNYEKRKDFCPSWAITAGNVGGKSNVLLDRLRDAVTEDFGLSYNYKTASEKERLSLLAGFLDADGYFYDNCYEFCQKNSQIAQDLAFIARSLGFMATESVHRIDDFPYHRVTISGDTGRIPVKITYKKAGDRKQIKNTLRTGFSVKAIGKGKYFGFTLSGDGRFLLGDFTVTHNTETAKALSDVLGASLVRIDCQEYQHGHEVAKLTGSPPGYVGYEDGGHLTRAIGKTPFSVVLLDEVEKAHNNFHERMLQIIDDGVLTDNKGKKVSFRETIVIMTSNIGVKEVEAINKTLGFGDVSLPTDDKKFKARDEALKGKFKPEFLNRIDEVVHFRSLTHEDYMSILDILLAEVNDQIQKSRTLTLQFSLGAKNFLLERGIDKKFGARPLRRTIKKYLNTPLAVAILKEEINGGSKVSISLNKAKDGLVFKTSPKERTNDARSNGDDCQE